MRGGLRDVRPDGRRHHIQNLIFWVAAALTAGLLFPCFSGSRRGFAVPVALLLLYPGAAETFGWIVGREDLFFTMFACLAFRARLEYPDSACAPLPYVALALLCKETAVVIAPLLNWVGAWVPRTTPRTKGAGTAILRELAPWIVVAVWFGVRYALFGNLGMSYRNASFFSYADPVKMARNVAESLFQLVAPVNVPQAAELRIHAWPIRLAFIAFSAAILVAGFRYHRRPGDGRRVMALLAVIGAPILLVSPLYGVGESLEQGRALALPGAAWVIILGLGRSTARSPEGGAARSRSRSFLALIPVSMVSLYLALVPYAGATKIAEDMLGDIAEDRDPAGLGRPHDPHRDRRPENGARSSSSTTASTCCRHRSTRPSGRRSGPRRACACATSRNGRSPTRRRFTRSASSRSRRPTRRRRPWIIAFRKAGAPVTDPWFSAVAPGGHVGPIPEAVTPGARGRGPGRRRCRHSRFASLRQPGALSIRSRSTCADQAARISPIRSSTARACAKP